MSSEADPSSQDVEDDELDVEPVGSAFPGDTGQLSMPTRRVMVTLLLGPAVDGRRQTKLWPILLRDEQVIRSRLHELFLDLVLDHEQKIAFTRQVSADDLDAPVLLRRAPLTFLDSALLLFLRQRLTQADAQGERAVLSQEEMIEHLRVYDRDENADRARFDSKIDAALEKAKRLSLLHKVKGTEDRYEVSPTLKLLFAAEEIQALMRVYDSVAKADVGTQVARPAEDQGNQ
jgi:hypothetical protein